MRAILNTDYGATSRTGTITVSTVQGGGVRLAVSHSDPNIDSYTSRFCTGLEMSPAKWREAIAKILERLPPLDQPDPFLPVGDGASADTEFEDYLQRPLLNGEAT